MGTPAKIPVTMPLYENDSPGTQMVNEADGLSLNNKITHELNVTENVQASNLHQIHNYSGRSAKWPTSSKNMGFRCQPPLSSGTFADFCSGNVCCCRWKAQIICTTCKTLLVAEFFHFLPQLIDQQSRHQCSQVWVAQVFLQSINELYNTLNLVFNLNTFSGSSQIWWDLFLVLFWNNMLLFTLAVHQAGRFREVTTSPRPSVARISYASPEHPPSLEEMAGEPSQLNVNHTVIFLTLNYHVSIVNNY